MMGIPVRGKTVFILRRGRVWGRVIDPKHPFLRDHMATPVVWYRFVTPVLFCGRRRSPMRRERRWPRWMKKALHIGILKATERQWPRIWHADVSWPPPELNRLVTVYWFFSFWHYFDLVKQDKFVVSRRMHGENSLKFSLLMYPDHLQNWLHFGLGLLVSFLFP